VTVAGSLEAPPDLAAGLRAFWARVAAPRRALLAVSGGSDSTALMRVAAVLARDGVAEFSVATVDHGLRAGSRQEADAVGAAARRLGFSHAILSWAGAKPRTGLQAAARAARYGLLVRRAHEIGAGAIVVAHTADDQAETVLMRAARRSGPRGLSGMAEQSLIAADASEPILLLRPFLSARRADLRAYLAAVGADFIDDPSNEDRRFERVRVREALSQGGDGAPEIGRILRQAEAMRLEAKSDEAAENARFVALGGAFTAYGAARLATPPPSDARLIARLISAVGGGDYLPAEVAAAAALAKLMSGAAATMGGVVIERAGEGIALCREPAALFGRAGVAPLASVPLGAGERILWDRRFIIENNFGAKVIVEAVGDRASSLAAAEDEAAGLATAPALLVGGEIVAVAGETSAVRSLADERFNQRVNRFATMP
jgi:tRNA(Ile)-lysidine synthase